MAVAVATGVVVAVVDDVPARADVLGTVSAVQTVVSTVRQAYSAYDQYILGNHQPSDLEQIRTLILQQTDAIKSEVDALAAGDVQSACEDTLIAFAGITTDTPLQINSLYDIAIHCVTQANAAITQLSNDRPDQHALDSIGFSLAAGAPLALIASVANNQPTDALKESILHAWRTLIARMRPTCGFTPDVDVEATTDADVVLHSQGGQGVPIDGHGACYSYQVAEPTPIQGSIIRFPTGGPGSGTGALPWRVTGAGYEDFCGGVDVCHHATLAWPSKDGFDFSIAVDQAMAVTSYPVAQASLNALAPSAEPFGTPVAMASVDTEGTPAQVEVLGVKGDGSMLRGVLDHDSSLPEHRNTFSGWTAFPGPRFAVKSVSAAVTYDRRVQVFALDRIGHVYTSWETLPNDHSAWSPWAEVDLAGVDLATEFTSISAVRQANNNFLTLYASTTGGNVVSRTQVAVADTTFNSLANSFPGVSSWTPWQALPSNGTILQVTASGGTDPVSRAPSQVFAVTKSGAVLASHPAAQAGTWSDWATVKGPESGAFPVRALQAVTPGGDLSPYLYATANDGSVYWKDTSPVATVKDFQPYPYPGSFPGGLGVGKEGVGVGWPELFGVDAAGNVSYASGTFDTYTAWQAVGGGTVLRPAPRGPYASPTLARPTVTGGSVAISFTDNSTNEDQFSIRRVTVGRALSTLVTTRNTIDKAGTGRQLTVTDSTPDPNAPCYVVAATDLPPTFTRMSDVLCVNPPTVPNVVGQTQATATANLAAVALPIRIQTVGLGGACQIPGNGLVTAMNPAAGSVQEPGTVITLTVCSLRTSVVPNLIGLPLRTAQNTLSNLGIRSDSLVIEYDRAPIGTVTTQSVPAGTVVVQESTSVDLKISKGLSPTVVPPTGWVEIFPPIISSTECLDVPNASSGTGVQLQLFHCHGYDSSGAAQRWQFIKVGTGPDGRDSFQIKNVGNNLCAMLADSSGTNGTKLVQGSCTNVDSYKRSQWQILDQSTGHVTNGSTAQFELRNVGVPGLCMAPSNSSGQDHTPMQSGICTVGNTIGDTLQLG